MAATQTFASLPVLGYVGKVASRKPRTALVQTCLGSREEEILSMKWKASRVGKLSRDETQHGVANGAGWA